MSLFAGLHTFRRIQSFDIQVYKMLRRPEKVSEGPETTCPVYTETPFLSQLPRKNTRINLDFFRVKTTFMGEQIQDQISQAIYHP